MEQRVFVKSPHKKRPKQWFFCSRFHIPACLDQQSTFVLNIALNLVVFLVEIIVGYKFKSISLISDSFHMLSDVISMFVGLYALRKAQTDRESGGKENALYTYGFERYQILGSLFNGILLASFSFSIFVDSLQRIVEPEPIKEPFFVIIAGAIGLGSNLFSMVFFYGHVHQHSHSHEGVGDEVLSIGGGGSEAIQGRQSSKSSSVDVRATYHSELSSAECETTGNPVVVAEKGLEVVSGTSYGKEKHQPKSSTYLNVVGVFLHIIGDLIGSILVLISASIAYYIKQKWVDYCDPVLSLILALIMSVAAYHQVNHSSPVLIQKCPSFYRLEEIKRDILEKFPSIVNVHELHIWQLASSIIICSMHVCVTDHTSIPSLINGVNKYFHRRGIYSVTIQPELLQPPSHYNDQLMLEAPVHPHNQCNVVFHDENNIKHTCCPHVHKRRVPQ